MALAGVGAAVKYIGDLLVEEAKYLYGVEQQVEELQDELEWMTCFLEDVDAKRDRDARMRKWIKHITWLAYQSEDIIESFILKVELQRRGSMMQKLKGYSCIMREAKDLHELGSDIDALKLKISTLTSRLHTYGIKTTEQGSSWSVRREQLRKSYAHDMEDENNIIGLDNDVKEVVNKLMDDDSRVVALWGVGGLGKTTLAKKVFHHQDVRQYFDACAWASISQQCNAKSVLKELLRQLTSDDEVNDKANHGCLMEKLCKVQREKKCLVVLDDIWKKEAWDSLKAAFPNERENSSGGKLMLTTRIESVAKYADGNAFIYKQVPLDDSKAWQLLRKKLGSDPLTIFGQDNVVCTIQLRHSVQSAKLRGSNHQFNNIKQILRSRATSFTSSIIYNPLRVQLVLSKLSMPPWCLHTKLYPAQLRPCSSNVMICTTNMELLCFNIYAC